MVRCSAILLLLIFVPGAPAQFRAKWVDFPGHVYCLAFSPDGKLLATGTGTRGSDEASLMLWEVATGKRWRELPGHNSCSSLAFSPDGKTLAANGAKGSTTHIWDIPSLRIRQSIKVRPEQVRCLAISPDGKLLAAGGVGPAGTLWDLGTAKEVGTLKGAGPVDFLTFSPDSKTLATCAGRNPPVVWDVASGKERF